jgi:DNA repair ATPase RecN
MFSFYTLFFGTLRSRGVPGAKRSCIVRDQVDERGIRIVTGDARLQELARMLGGDPESQASHEHARELLETR